MCVKVFHDNLPNNGPTMVMGGKITTDGRVDEQSVVTGWIVPAGGGPQTNQDEPPANVPAGGGWTMHFSAMQNMQYKLTVKAEGVTGTTLATITIQVPPTKN